MAEVITTYLAKKPATIDHIKPPPTAEEIDRSQQEFELNEIRQRLQEDADDAFPNDGKSRYANIYVLLICWANEDPKLPVSVELNELADVFAHEYGFSVETWKIPGENCHNELSRKVLDFIAVGNDSRRDLKIVYYAGHGMLTKGRAPAWANLPDLKNKAFRQLKWAGIQNTLEEARSDVLIIFDCCASGTANTDDGRGTTELIAACGFNMSANGVGAHSFTRSLITELRLLSSQPCFTVSLLYNNILSRLQKYMPEVQELLKPPLHVPLTQDPNLPRGIQLSARRAVSSPLSTSDAGTSTASSILTSALSPLCTNDSTCLPFSGTGALPLSSTLSTLPSLTSLIDFDCPQSDLPRLDLNIWLQKSMPLNEFPIESFGDWLRMMPILAERVRIDPGSVNMCALLKFIRNGLINTIRQDELDEKPCFKNIKDEISLTQKALTVAASILQQIDDAKKQQNRAAEELEKTVSSGFAEIVKELGKQGEKAAESADKLNSTINLGLASVVDEVKEQGREVVASTGRIESTVLSFYNDTAHSLQEIQRALDGLEVNGLPEKSRLHDSDFLAQNIYSSQPYHRLLLEAPMQSESELPSTGSLPRGNTYLSHSRTKTALKNWLCNVEVKVDEEDEIPERGQQNSLRPESSKPRRRTRRSVLIVDTGIPLFKRGFKASCSWHLHHSIVKPYSFTLQLKTYNIIPYKSPIFDACRAFDISAVQRLFSAGLASPFDRAHDPDISPVEETLVTLLPVNSKVDFDRGIKLLGFLFNLNAASGRVIAPKRMTNIISSPFRDKRVSTRSESCLRLILRHSEENPLDDTGVCCFITRSNVEEPFYRMLASETYWPVDWGQMPNDEAKLIFCETDFMVSSDPEGERLKNALYQGRRYLACTPSLIFTDRPYIDDLSSIHSLLLQASQSKQDDMQVAYQKRLSTLMRQGSNPRTTCWMNDPVTNSNISPTAYAQHLDLESLWIESLEKADWDQAQIQDLLDDEMYAGVVGLLSETLPYKTRQECRQDFVKYLCEGHYTRLSAQEIRHACRELESNLGFPASPLAGLIKSANTAWEQMRMPGGWFASPHKSLIPEVDFILPSEDINGNWVDWSKYFEKLDNEEDEEEEQEWWDALSETEDSDP